jgi:hypothetical protein
MFPMANTGFFKGQGGGGGFRYLHDEISGGIFAASHIKTLSSYSGSCVNIGDSPNETDYGFSNNIVDLSQVDSDFGTNQDVNTFYDQFEVNDVSGGSTQWVKSVNEFADAENNLGILNGATSGDLSSHTGATTVITVTRFNTTTFSNGFSWGVSSNSAINFAMFYVSGLFVVRLASASTANRLDSRYTVGSGFTNDTDLHLSIITYDGSETIGGVKLYRDNMVTAVTKSAEITSGTYVNTPFFPAIRMGYVGGTNSYLPGFIYETHVFNKELNQTERETVKEILEQYYTF